MTHNFLNTGCFFNVQSINGLVKIVILKLFVRVIPYFNREIIRINLVANNSALSKYFLHREMLKFESKTVNFVVWEVHKVIQQRLHCDVFKSGSTLDFFL
jgi:hypothetical protein